MKDLRVSILDKKDWDDAGYNDEKVGPDPAVKKISGDQYKGIQVKETGKQDVIEGDPIDKGSVEMLVVLIEERQKK